MRFPCAAECEGRNTKTPKGDVGSGKELGSGRRRPEKDLRRGKAETARRPDEEERLDEALDESFPASDPPAPAHPDVTGWDADDEAVRKAGGKR